MHERGALLPPAHHWPTPHASQSSRLVSVPPPSMKVPGSHAAGMGTELPLGQKWPTLHDLQVGWPNSSWYEPEGHSTHRLLFAADAWVPGLHGVGAIEAVVQLEPGGQSEHCSLAVRLEVLEKEPASQGSGAEAPGGQT